MKNNRYWLTDKQDYDPEWIKELALHSYVINAYDLTYRDKKLVIDLFHEYQIDGFERKAAMKKALLVFDSFEF